MSSSPYKSHSNAFMTHVEQASDLDENEESTAVSRNRRSTSSKSIQREGQLLRLEIRDRQEELQSLKLHNQHLLDIVADMHLIENHKELLAIAASETAVIDSENEKLGKEVESLKGISASVYEDVGAYVNDDDTQ